MNISQTCKLSWLEHNTTIKQRIWLGFALILVVLTALSVGTYFKFNILGSGINRVTETIQPAVLTSQNLAFQLESSNYALGFYILTKEDSYKDKYFSLLDDAQASLEKLGSYDYIRNNEAMTSEIQSLGSRLDTLMGFKDRVVELVNNDALNIPAMALAGEKLNPLAQQMQSMVSEMILSEWGEDNTDESRSEYRQALYDLRYYNAQLVGELRTYLAFRADINIDNMKSMIDVIDSKLAFLEESSDMYSFEQEEMLPQYKTKLVDYKAALNEAVDVHKSDKYRSDIYLAQHSIGPEISKIQNELWGLLSQLNADISLQSTQLQEESTNSSNFVLIGMGIGILAGLLIAYFMSRMITVPINDVVRAFDDLAQGEGDLTHRLNEEGRSELAKLSIGFNRFADKVHHLVSQVAEEVRNLSEVVQNVSVIVEQTQQGSITQKEKTSQVATAITEMTATVQDVATNADLASQSAQQADTNARSGQSIVSQTIESINQLDSEIESGAIVVNKLESDAESIGSVLDVIRGIAEQTNLLALNAAIEAARAGEQGRGFAVVADEVRTLASRTQDSTKEIQEMIDSLQEQARAAVKSISQGQEKAKTNVENASQAGEALNSITSSVETISSMNIQIASAAQEQSVVAEDINKNVVYINEVANDNASASERLAASSTDLARLTEDLRGLVSQFKF
ncbi:MAG: methyl-accepting chemotaxis protein [Gammaproteobacteria bacterium]